MKSDKYGTDKRSYMDIDMVNAEKRLYMEKAEAIGYIDMHADTITELKRGETLQVNQRMISLSKLQNAGAMIQFFSAYIPTGTYRKLERNFVAALQFEMIHRRYVRELTSNSDVLMPILRAQDIDVCRQCGKIGTIFTIEDGGVLCGKANRLQKVYDKGVRLISLTWNHENQIGYPNSTDAAIMNKGLKKFGIETIKRMNEMGMLVDVSHLSDGGFWDVAKYTTKPFVASHSNARALTHHPRNMTDQMIKTLAQHGGAMGLNFAPQFLNDSMNSRIEDMVRHVKYIRNVGGSDILALGTDFDGIHGELEVEQPTDMVKLFDAMKKAGIPDSELDKMRYKNVKRVLMDCM